MRRRVLIIALFLLLGAAINIAVAWGCARWSPFRSLEWAPATVAQTLWLHECGWDSDVVAIGRGLGVDWQQFLGHKASSLRFIGFEHVVAARLDVGLPLRAMHGSTTGNSISSNTTTYGWVKRTGDVALEPRPWIIGSGIAMRLDPASGREIPIPPMSRVLPLQVSVLPFALNTLFYAAIAWLLIRGPFALRRIIRAQRGRCAACGYDLRGQRYSTGAEAKAARCPECGAACALVAPLSESGA